MIFTFIIGTVIREIRLQRDGCWRFQVIPYIADRIAAVTFKGNLLDVNIRDGTIRLIRNSRDEDPILSSTNDGQHVV